MFLLLTLISNPEKWHHLSNKLVLVLFLSGSFISTPEGLKQTKVIYEWEINDNDIGGDTQNSCAISFCPYLTRSPTSGLPYPEVAKRNSWKSWRHREIADSRRCRGDWQRANGVIGGCGFWRRWWWRRRRRRERRPRGDEVDEVEDVMNSVHMIVGPEYSVH